MFPTMWRSIQLEPSAGAATSSSSAPLGRSTTLLVSAVSNGQEDINAALDDLERGGKGGRDGSGWVGPRGLRHGPPRQAALATAGHDGAGSAAGAALNCFKVQPEMG